MERNKDPISQARNPGWEEERTDILCRDAVAAHLGHEPHDLGVPFLIFIVIRGRFEDGYDLFVSFSFRECVSG